jgi:hypothetical protein
LLVSSSGVPSATRASELSITNEELVEHFLLVAFGDEVLSRNPQELRLLRWTSPVKVVFLDVIDDRQAQVIKAHLQHISEITGLQLKYTRSRRRADLFIRINNVQTILDDLTTMQRNPLNSEETTALIASSSREVRLREQLGMTNMQCLVLIFNNSGLSGYVGIERSMAFEAFNACVKEELTQVLGLPGDSDRIGRSIMSEDQEDVELTEQDVWFLKILYGPEMRNGMTLREARAAARRFLSSHRPSGAD